MSESWRYGGSIFFNTADTDGSVTSFLHHVADSADNIGYQHGETTSMRINTDFVTNSSTCSYVFAGWKCEINPEFIDDIFQVLSRIAQEDLSQKFEKTQRGLIELLYEFAKFDILHGSDSGVPDDNCVYIGKELASITDDCELTDVIQDINTIEEQYKQLAELKRDGLAKGPLKLVIGSRMC